MATKSYSNLQTIAKEGAYGAGKIVGDKGADVTVALTTDGIVKAVSAIKGIGKEASALGDLTKTEVKGIQNVVDQAERPLEVVGSAASGTRRGVGTDLPVGKGPGIKSDIDYLTNPAHLPYFMDVQHKLPSLDPKTGINPSVVNPYMGPGIRFEPGAKPSIIQPQN